MCRLQCVAPSRMESKARSLVVCTESPSTRTNKESVKRLWCASGGINCRMDGLVQQAGGRNRAVGQGSSEGAGTEGGRCVRGGESLYVEGSQRQTVGSCLMTRLAVVSQVHGLGELAAAVSEDWQGAGPAGCTGEDARAEQLSNVWCTRRGCGAVLRGCEVVLRRRVRGCRLRIGRSPDRELSKSHQINDRRRRGRWSTRLAWSGAVVEDVRMCRLNVR